MKRFLFILGFVISAIAGINMLFQWFFFSSVNDSKDTLTKQESISVIFLLLGIYLIITFNKKSKLPF
jgi:hypothetical protein